MARRTELLLRSQLVPIFLLHVRSAGGDVEALISEFDLPPDAATQPEVVVPLSRFHAFSDAAARAAGDPFLGLHVASAIPRGRYGLLEFIARSADTVEEAVHSFLRYSALLNEVARFSFERGDQDAVLTVQVPNEPLALGRQSNEFSIAIFSTMIAQLSGRPFMPRRAWFAHPKPADCSELERHFDGTALEFGRGENGMLFDVEVLDTRVVTADPALHAVLDDQAKRVAGEKPPADDFVARVREAVRRAMSSGSPGIEVASAVLRMSARTLQRRLEDHGTAFKDIVDEERLRAARLYLDDPTIGLSEIAFRLGYSDLRSFTRAFKRWVGQTPGEYREQRLTSPRDGNH